MHPNDQGISVHCAFGGFCISGREIEVRIGAVAQGQLSVSVVAYPILTGFKDSCRLNSSEARTDFAPSEVVVTEQRLHCMRREYKRFQEGMIVDLEPGMAEILQERLPALEKVALVADSITRRVIDLVEPEPVAHRTDFIVNVVAGVVLNHLTPADPLQREVNEHWAGKDNAFVSAFSDHQVQNMLARTEGRGPPS